MEENVKQYYAFVKGDIRLPSHLTPQKTERGCCLQIESWKNISQGRQYGLHRVYGLLYQYH